MSTGNARNGIGLILAIALVTGIVVVTTSGCGKPAGNKASPTTSAGQIASPSGKNANLATDQPRESQQFKGKIAVGRTKAVSNGKAQVRLESATIALGLSGDMTKVEEAVVEFKLIEDGPAGAYSIEGRQLLLWQEAPVTINGGRFVVGKSDQMNKGRIEGRITAPNALKGTVHIFYTSIDQDSGSYSTSDLGTWPWTASRQTSGTP